MKMNNRFIYGILSIVLAAVIAFISISVVTRATNGTKDIVRVKNAVNRGNRITEDDLEIVKVGSFNLPENVAKKIEDVAGTYAATNLCPGDYILPQKVSSSPLSSDQTLNHIPDGKVAISITVQHLANGLSDKLQSGDIIRLFHYDNTTNVIDPVVDIPELHFMKVLSVTDSDGLDIDYNTPPAEDEERQQTATITLLASPEQALLLTRFENEGVLHAALVSRGNEALADELLERQDSLLLEMYADLDGDGTPDGESTQENLSGNTDAPSEETAANAGETKGGDH